MPCRLARAALPTHGPLHGTPQRFGVHHAFLGKALLRISRGDGAMRLCRHPRPARLLHIFTMLYRVPTGLCGDLNLCLLRMMGLHSVNFRRRKPGTLDTDV